VSRREAILEKVREIPAIPASASRALQLIQDPEFTMDDLVRLIELDQVATANVLRVANSASQSRGADIATVKDAVVRMGAKKLSSLLTATAVGPLANRPLEGYDLPTGELWRHSVATAFAAEILAKALKVAAPPHVFTAALLHDLGKIVLDVFIQADAEPIKAMLYQANITFEMAEKQILGASHAEVGAELLTEWKVPEDVVTAVLWHHKPDQAPETSVTIDLVHLGNQVALDAGVGKSKDLSRYLPSLEAMGRLGAGEDHLKAAVSDLEGQMENVEDLFKVTAGA
jgi:putative nucleotidyltransferase with HDIG domain